MALTLWLGPGPGAGAGVGRGPGPVDRPEEEEGERDGAALLLALLRVLLEADRPGAASCSPTGRHTMAGVVAVVVTQHWSSEPESEFFMVVSWSQERLLRLWSLATTGPLRLI